MNLVTYMEKKVTEFDLTCQFVVDNLAHWNSSVKKKEYQLNSDDSSSLKVAKIYRYLNEHDTNICRLIQHKRNKAEPNLK